MITKRERTTVIIIITCIFVVLMGMSLLMKYIHLNNENGNLTNEKMSTVVTDINNHLLQNTYKLNGLEIASADFDSTYNWEDAKIACQNLGQGWRLPSMDELTDLFKHRKEIGGFKEEKYWSGDEYQRKIAANEILFNYQGFKDVSPIHSELNVRAVKTINK